MREAVGLMMLFILGVGLAVGLLIGSGHANDIIIKQLKKAEKDGKSLKDAIYELEKGEVWE